MAEIIENLTDSLYRACHACCRFVVTDKNSLDCVGFVCFEHTAIFFEWHTATPFDVNIVNIEAKAGAHINPEMGELAEAGGQHLVAGIERIGDR